MKRSLAAALLATLVMETYPARPADACGVKLTVKSSAPRKAVARTSNPSDVLLLGSPPRRLERDLSAAGHRVEVAPNSAAARRKSYAVVITDTNLQSEARSNFAESVVIVRSGDVAADMRSLEQQVARRPVKTDESRTVVAAPTPREPVAAGPAQPAPRQVVAADETSEATREPTTPVPPAAPERIATTPPRARPPAAELPPAEAQPGSVHDEVYFGLGSSRLPAARGLTRAVRWLKASGDVRVVIEGHADPTGSPEGNLALGQKRAERVRDFLVTSGIDESRLEVISYGDTRLKYGATDGRNRRVAIVVK